MKSACERQETGAVLVQTALLLVVLLLFVGLAVDVGSLYTERQRMQNAADAGALAGAHAICFGGDPVAAATDYAQNRNGADTTLVEVIDGYQVRVIATRAATTYFMALAGMDVVTVSAEATAACGASTRLCGAFPVAFDKATWDKIPCRSDFYIWDDDSVTDDLCAKCQCEGVIGSAASVGPGQRGWVRFSAPPAPFPNPYRCGGNCGTNALRCWIAHDYAGPLDIGDCVPGDPGVISSALQEAEKREGDNLAVLLWDTGPCERVVGSCPGTLYRIAGFGYVQLVEVESKLTIPPREGYKQNECPKNAKAMRATKLCNPPAVPCGRTDGSSPTGEFGAVSLIDSD
ncbi:MAG: hypothetical protein GX552_07800 [Chloroflexi bacterium]|nr:hypothetical protein [Chloroflexota bacterium]